MLEWCGHGTLADAFLAGWFRQPGSQEPSFAAILLTVSEAASGLSMLHNADVVHGNLNGDKCDPCACCALHLDGAMPCHAMVPVARACHGPVRASALQQPDGECA